MNNYKKDDKRLKSGSTLVKRHTVMAIDSVRCCVFCDIKSLGFKRGFRGECCVCVCVCVVSGAARTRGSTCGMVQKQLRYTHQQEGARQRAQPIPRFLCFFHYSFQTDKKNKDILLNGGEN